MTNFEKQQERLSRIRDRIKTAKALLEFMLEQEPQTDETQTLAERLKGQIKNDEIALLVATSTP